MKPEERRDLAGYDLAHDPAARRYVARPVRVQAEFAVAGGSVRTLEGEVRHRAGAALLRGVGGERWPVEQSVFIGRYEPCGGQPSGEPGPYCKRRVEVLARRLLVPFRTRAGVERDELRGRRGDWLVQYADGTHGIVAAGLFHALYRPARLREPAARSVDPGPTPAARP